MLLLTNKFTKIELFGLNLILTERTVKDNTAINALVVEARAFTSSNFQLAVLQHISIIQAGLKYNFKLLKWWQVLKYLELKKKLSVKYIMNNLSVQSVYNLADKIFELEGVDLKKKRV